MKELHIGEYIRQKRKEQGLTLEELCGNIYDPAALSRVENGERMPSYKKLKALLERLGEPLLNTIIPSKKEKEIEDIQKEIVSCNIHREREIGLKKLQELEQLIDDDDKLTLQFILRTKALLGRPEGDYSADERLKLLDCAIRITTPCFDLDNICQWLYSLEDIKVIIQIANVYSETGNHKKAADIFNQLLRYIDNHFKNKLQSGGYLPLVAHNYALELALCKRYDDAVEIAELGWKSCVDFEYYQNLPGLVSIIAECYFYLGNRDKSIELYHQAYYTYKSIGRFSDAQRIKSEIHKYFGIDILF